MTTANRKTVCFFGDRLDVASIALEAGKPVLTQLDSFSVDGDQLGGLQRLRRDIGKAPCTTLLSQGGYQLLQVDAPDGDGEARKQVLRWKVKDMVDFPVEEATIDVLDIRLDGIAASRGRQCFAAVARNSMLAPLIQLFQDAKLNLDVVDLPELAQRNVAALFEQENRGLVLLNFTADGGLLTFTSGGELFAFRRIEISLEQLEQADEMRRADLFDRVALEVQRSVDNFERVFNSIALSRMLAIDLPSVPGLFDHLRGYLSLPVAPLDLTAVLGAEAIPELRKPRRQAETLLTIGAALRDLPLAVTQ